MELAYEAYDGRGETKDTVTVYRNGKVVKRFAFSLEDTSPFFTYFATWKIPKKEKGKLKFCVQSLDRAGNQSKVSCAAIALS